MAYEYDPNDPTKKLRPNLPGGIPSPLTVDTTAPGGVVQSGERMLYAPPTGPTQTNFPTSRDVIPGQPAPVAPLAAQPVAPAPAPMQPAPIDTSKVTHLTTDAELAAMSKPRVKLEPMTLYSLGIAARGGDVEAQKTLQKQGITATTATLTNESPAMTQMKAQIAARPGGEQILKPAERKVAEMDQARIFNVLKQERDLKWEIEETQYKENLRQTELGLKQAALEQAPSIAADRELDISIKEAQLANLPEAQKKAELERQQTELENDQKRYFNELLGIAPAQSERPIKSPEQTVVAIENAKTVQDLQKTYSELKTALTTHGTDEDTINGLTVAAMNASYRNPIELAVDKGAEYTPIYTANNDNIKKVQEDVDNALSRRITPDDAVSEILAKNPEKAKDNQFMLDVSFAVWDAYNKMGTEALTKSKEIIAQSKNKALTDLVSQLPNLQTMTPQSIIAEQNNALSKSMQQINAATAVKPGMKDLLMQQAQQRLGVQNIAGMDSDQIQLAWLAQQQLKYSGNPAMQSLLAETSKRITTGIDRDKIPPALQQYMTAYVATFAPLAAKVDEDIKKKQKEEQAKREVIEKEAQDYAKKNSFVVEFDPLTHNPVFFANAEGAKAYRNEPSELGKANLAKSANDLTRERLADPGYQLFIGLSDEERNNILQKINLAKAIWNQYQTGVKPSTDALASFKELSIENAEQIPAAINAYSDSYGLGDVFRETKAAEDAFWFPDAAEWEVITGQKPEVAPAMEEQPEKELPTLTPEQYANAPVGTRFKTTSGNIRVKEGAITPSPTTPKPAAQPEPTPISEQITQPETTPVPSPTLTPEEQVSKMSDTEIMKHFAGSTVGMVGDVISKARDIHRQLGEEAIDLTIPQISKALSLSTLSVPVRVAQYEAELGKKGLSKLLRYARQKMIEDLRNQQKAK